MSEELPSGRFSLSDVVEAVEILQRANMIPQAVQACDAVGFRMCFADVSHGLKIAEVLNRAIAEVRKTDPDYYKDVSSGPDVLVGGPCPCRGSRRT